MGVGAGDGTRTRDILLGKQILYQLSYSRPGGLDSLRLRPRIERQFDSSTASDSQAWQLLWNLRSLIVSKLDS